MVLGIIGCRDRDNRQDYDLVLQKVKELKPDKIISGGCSKGGDHFAEIIANELKIPITIYKPNIKNYEMPYYQAVKLYYRRNREIANNVDKLIALVDRKDESKGGTGYTVNYFLKNKPETDLIRL